MAGYPGQTPAAVGIVADNVRSVVLVMNGEIRLVAIVNNSIYSDLKGLQAGDTIELRATYDDGSTWVYPLFNTKSKIRSVDSVTPRAG